MVNHHQILHIRISLSCKFQLQQTILIFWNKFTRTMNPSGQKKKKKKKKKWTSPLNPSYSN